MSARPRLLGGWPIPLAALSAFSVTDRFHYATESAVLQGLLMVVGASVLLVVYAVALRLPGGLQRVVVFGFIAAAIGVVAIVYPAVDARRPAGTDTDDALRIGVRSVVSGEDPYEKSTYLGNPVAPLPGSFVLAAPSVLATGRAGAANLAGVAVGAVACAALVARDRRRRAATMWLCLVAVTPGVWLELAAGTDEFANGCWLFAGGVGVIRYAHGRARSALGGVGYGVVLLTRTVAPVVALLPWIALWARGRRREAIWLACGAAVTAIGLLSPWLGEIVDGNFVPITVVSDEKLRLSQLSVAVYRACLVSGVLVALGYAAWAIRTRPFGPRQERTLLFAAPALVLVVPVVLLVALSPVHFAFAGYGKLALPFLLAAVVFHDAARPGATTTA